MYDIQQLNLVPMAKRSHLFPCRTQKLSSLAPMVVGLTFRESRTVPGYFKSFEAIIIVSRLFVYSLFFAMRRFVK